jgi:regulator of sigma E protease
LSYVLAFVGFSLLIILHEFGHFVAAKRTGMRVERFSLFFPPHVWKRRRGETEYAIGTIPLGGYVRISGMSPNEELPEEVRSRAYLNMPVWKRIVVIAAGPAMNILIALLIFVFLFLAVGTSEGTSRVDSVERGSASAGLLRSGDELVSVDGVRGDPAELREQIATHRCAGAQVDGCAARKPAVVVVRRDGKLVTLRVTPRYDAAAERPRLGFSFAVTERSYGPVESVDASVSEMWRVTTLTADAITRIFYDAEAREEVSGVVGSYEVTRQTIEFDWAQALNVLAIISLSLAIVNLFPFLPLDGGHIFWALAEKVRGRPIPFSVMERASVVGFVLVMFLFAIGLTNDIGRLRGEGFGTP